MRCCSVPSFLMQPQLKHISMGKVLFHIHHTRWQLGTAYSAATLDVLKYFRGQITWPKCYNFPLNDLSILSTDHNHFFLCPPSSEARQTSKGSSFQDLFPFIFIPQNTAFLAQLFLWLQHAYNSNFWVVDDVSGLDKIKCSCNTTA